MVRPRIVGTTFILLVFGKLGRSAEADDLHYRNSTRGYISVLGTGLVSGAFYLLELKNPLMLLSMLYFINIIRLISAK